MKRLLTLALIAGGAAAAFAQDSVPDLAGTWTGKSRSLVLGNDPFHPGSETPDDPPRIRELDFTFEIEGQGGSLFWGKAWANADPDVKETFALAIRPDGKTIVGADGDGAHAMTLVSPDRIERCYVHAGTSPSGSIVAGCGALERVK